MDGALARQPSVVLAVHVPAPEPCPIPVSGPARGVACRRGQRRSLLFLSPTVAFRCRSMLFWTSGGGEQKVTRWFSRCTNVFKRWHQQRGRGGNSAELCLQRAWNADKYPELDALSKLYNVWKVWRYPAGRVKTSLSNFVFRQCFLSAFDQEGADVAPLMCVFVHTPWCTLIPRPCAGLQCLGYAVIPLCSFLLLLFWCFFGGGCFFPPSLSWNLKRSD